MKNRDLIKKLLGFNLDADISLIDSEDIMLSWICEDETLNTWESKNNTMKIFIEGTDIQPHCQHEYMLNNTLHCKIYGEQCSEVKECFEYLDNNEENLHYE